MTARGRLEQREMVLLRLRSDDGLVGLGEAVPLSLRGGAGLARCGRGAGAAGRARLARRGGAAWRCAGPLRSRALCGAHGAARPAGTQGGGRGLDRTGRRRRTVECNATLVAGEPAAVAAEAARWAEDGFTTFKLKLGSGDDFAQVFAVREAVGPRARIRVDANAAWDVETAKRTLRALEPLEVELAEQPVATLEEAAEVAASTSIPIAGDESIESRGRRRACAWRWAPARSPGSSSPRSAARRRRSRSPRCCPPTSPARSTARSGSPPPLRSRRPCATGPMLRSSGLAHGLATQRLFSSTIASVECELRDGMLYPPPGPGLGVEIDETALAAHRL